MKIWIVNPFDPVPGEAFREGRYSFLARLLARRGHQVVWWSSRFSHIFKAFRDNQAVQSALEEGITLHLLDAVAYSKNVSLRRIVNHRMYARQFAEKALSLGTSPDVIIASSPPLHSAWASIEVGRALGARVIIDVQDLWPEAFEVIFPSKARHLARCAFYLWRRWEDRIFQNAGGLSAVSQDYLRRAQVAQDKAKPARVIHLGTDLRHFDDAVAKGRLPLEKGENDFWVAYVGSISRNYDLRTVLLAADMAKRKGLNRIRFLFAGTGEMLPILKRLAQDLDLKNVNFLGLLQYEDMAQMLVHADVAINAVKPRANSYFPNKVFDYCAARLPIVNSIRGGELEALIRQQKIGAQYTAEDASSLFDCIESLYRHGDERKAMGANARLLAERVFDRNVEYPMFIDLIGETIRIQVK